MPDEFPCDVFLSHSAKDKAVVRPLAERLRADGVKVWFDEWVLAPGDNIPAKIEEGMERSHVLLPLNDRKPTTISPCQSMRALLFSAPE